MFLVTQAKEDEEEIVAQVTTVHGSHHSPTVVLAGTNFYYCLAPRA